MTQKSFLINTVAAIRREKNKPNKSDALKIDSKVLSSKGRGLGDRFFIEKTTKALPPQTRMNRATENEAFRRGEAIAGSVFQTIKPSPNADIIVDIPTPKTCHLIGQFYHKFCKQSIKNRP